MTSTYTTDSPETPDTFPLIVPALADRHIANTTIPITKKLRDMIFLPLFGNSQIEGGGSPAPNLQYTNSNPATAEFVRNGLVSVVLVPGKYTICLGRIWYSNDVLMLA